MLLGKMSLVKENCLIPVYIFPSVSHRTYIAQAAVIEKRASN